MTLVWVGSTLDYRSGAGTGGPGGPLAPPIFGRSVNPIPIGEGRLSPPITTGTPNVFHLPAPLRLVQNKLTGISFFAKKCT